MRTDLDYDYVDPDHYQRYGMQAWEMMIHIFGKDAFVKFCEMNAFKYRMRIGDKPGQDIETELQKIKWYENKADELR